MQALCVLTALAFVASESRAQQSSTSDPDAPFSQAGDGMFGTPTTLQQWIIAHPLRIAPSAPVEAVVIPPAVTSAETGSAVAFPSATPAPTLAAVAVGVASPTQMPAAPPLVLPVAVLGNSPVPASTIAPTAPVPAPAAPIAAAVVLIESSPVSPALASDVLVQTAVLAGSTATPALAPEPLSMPSVAATAADVRQPDGSLLSAPLTTPNLAVAVAAAEPLTAPSLEPVAAPTPSAAPSLESAFAAAAMTSGNGTQLAFASPALTSPSMAAKAREALAGNPIYGNTGAYLCPFTEDGTVSPWVEKAMKAKLGGQLGGTAGAYAGQQLASQIPLFGGFLGKKIGTAVGKEAVLQMLGGWATIRQTTELSFSSAADMAAYIKSQNRTHPQYKQVIDATVQLYPDVAPYLGVAAP
ncbi:MAG: hypothetical protein V4709_15020 [Pseudomonadota bacterium]